MNKAFDILYKTVGAVANLASAAIELLKSDKQINFTAKPSFLNEFSPTVVLSLFNIVLSLFNIGKRKDKSDDVKGQQRDSLLALRIAYERFQSRFEIQNEKLKTYAFIFTFVIIMFFGYLFWSHSVNERERIQLELEQQQMAQMELLHHQIIEMKLSHQQQIYVISIFFFVGIVVSFFFGALVAWIIKK